MENVPLVRLFPGGKQFPTKSWNRIVDFVERSEPQPRRELIAVGFNTASETISYSRLVGIKGDALSVPQAYDDVGSPSHFFDRSYNVGIYDASKDLRFALTIDPIESGRVGRIQLDGVCRVWTDVIDVRHECVGPLEGTFVAATTSESTPLRVLITPQKTGEQWVDAIFCGCDKNGLSGHATVLFRNVCGHPASVSDATYLSNPEVFTMGTLEEALDAYRTRPLCFDGSHYQLVPDSTFVPCVCTQVGAHQ